MWFGNKSADSSVFPIKWWGLCPISWNWGWLVFILSHRVERRLLHKFQRLSQKRPRYFCLVPLGDWVWEKPLPCKASDYSKTLPSGVESSPSWRSGWAWTHRQWVTWVTWSWTIHVSPPNQLSTAKATRMKRAQPSLSWLPDAQIQRGITSG